MLSRMTTNELLAGFPAWVRTMPREQTYCYSDSGGCAFATYLQALGYANPRVSPSFFQREGNDIDNAPEALGGDISGALIVRPRTYGALADRLGA